MARNIWPLVQNRSDEEWTKSILRNEDLFRMGSKLTLGGCVCVCVCLSVQGLSLIAPDRRSRSGPDKHHSMRQSAGTTMALVTWRHVPRGTCRVPPREPLAKPFAPGYSPNGKRPRVQTFRVGAPRRGMCAFVSDDSIGSKLCPQGTISFFSLMPSSSETVRPIDTKFSIRMRGNKFFRP